jgi:DNA ligase D-like protein (predicted polymerase)
MSSFNRVLLYLASGAGRMLIRKNTKAFKTILEIIVSSESRGDREKLVRLFITKAGNSIHERINVEGIQGESGLFYDMNYQSLLNNLRSSTYQLHMSDELPGLYFFRSASNKTWDQLPFEFDEAIKKEFSSHADLPLVRKKEKAQSFALPTPKKREQLPAGKKREQPATGKKRAVANEKTESPRVVRMVPDRGPKQPDYKLKHKIEFTNLDKIIFRQAKITKQDVLDYYNKIADYILPYLKDRPLWTRLHSADSILTTVEVSREGLFQNNAERIPEWIQTVTVGTNKEQRQMLLCNDKEHLLFYVENGCLEFNTGHSRTKLPDSPDYIVMVIDSPGAEMANAIGVALHAKAVLDGLELPSFLKVDGISGLHIYIPLDAKAKFTQSRKVVEYICRLIGLKFPDRITLKGSDGFVYGKVTLDYSFNEEGKSIIAPYSLAAGPLSAVAAPISWQELGEDLRLEDFNHEAILKRLKQGNDPLENFFKKKVNADSLLGRLEENYAFLL